MKAIRTIVFAVVTIGVLAATVVLGLRAVRKRTSQPEAAGAADVARRTSTQVLSRPTPADRRIQAAERMIEQAGAKPGGYNLLCDAFTQKARETGDFSFNTRAEAALKRSFEIAPNNYDALKLQAKLLLTFHHFSEALETARRAQSLQPRDHDNYGALTDALVELGRYEEAVETAQQKVDLRPDTAAYARVSYLRALHGDTEGAIEAMQVAAKAASPRDPESVAWCRVQLGEELMNAGRAAEAEREIDKALIVFPDYYAALAAKARARLTAGDTASAIELYKRAQERVPLPETAIALGDLYTKLGQDSEAKRQYELVEFIERSGSAGSGTYSRQIAHFWADHDMKLDDALNIARRERAMRADIFTCDTLAWSLFKKGEFAEARKAIEEALRLGTRNAQIHYHAGMIYNALGDRRQGAKYLKLALDINPSFDVLQAEVARRTLDNINV
ncbi:MAG: tetratricopeptide repeat protein [Pyrinomonadaceae bacterium]|nr:tetratricopeptide repeat protein [Pyrinomonadaceae bacterium]